MDDSQVDNLVGTTEKDTQNSLNKYADKAESIANALIPEDGGGDHDMNSIKRALDRAAVNENYAAEVFTPAYKSYRISLTTELDGIEAHLEAVVETDRDEISRMATTVNVLEFTLN